MEKVLILGLSKSGIAAGVYLMKHNTPLKYEVYLTESKSDVDFITIAIEMINQRKEDSNTI